MITLLTDKSEAPENPQHLSAHQIVTSLTPWSFLSWNMKDHVLHIFYIIPIRCHHSNCLTFIGWFSSDKHNLSTDRHNLSSDFCILACGYTTLKFQARKCATQVLCYLPLHSLSSSSHHKFSLNENISLVPRSNGWSSLPCRMTTGRASPKTLICRHKRGQFMVTFKQILTMKMVNQNKEHPLFASDNKQRQSTTSILVLPG